LLTLSLKEFYYSTKNVCRSAFIISGFQNIQNSGKKKKSSSSVSRSQFGAFGVQPEDMSGMMNRHSVMNGNHTGTHFTNVADRGQGAVGQIRSGCLSLHQWPKNI